MSECFAVGRRTPGAKAQTYGYVRGTVHPDGTIELVLHELSGADLMTVKWPNAPDGAIHECYVHNDEQKKK